MYILDIDSYDFYHLSFPLAFPGRLPPWRVIWFRSPRVHKDQQVRLERQVLCGAQEMAAKRRDSERCRCFTPDPWGRFCCNLSICSIFFKWVTRLVTSTLSHLDVFRCCVILFLVMITPWCFQFFTGHVSSHLFLLHGSFDVQDGERGKRGPPGVQAELVDNLTDETDESDENSTNTCRPYRLRTETVFFQATCNSDVRLPRKKWSGTNFIYQKRTVTNNII